MRLTWKHAVAGLALAAVATTSALAQQRVFFGIATGGTGGTYYPLGGMLAQLISNKATVDGKTDWALLHPLKAAGAQPFAAYMSAVQIANAARTDKAVPTGWCSWYHFFEQVLYCTSS